MRKNMIGTDTRVIPAKFQESPPHQPKDTEIKELINRATGSFLLDRGDENQVKSIGECTCVRYEGGIGRNTADLIIRDKALKDPHW